MKPVNSLNEEFFEQIDSEEKAYWLGFLLADGGVSRNQLTVSLAIEDGLHVEKLRSALGSDAPLKRITFNNAWKSKDQIRLVIKRKAMAVRLAKWGIVPNKMLYGWVPELPRPLQRHFWRGVFDGDGYISIMVSRNEVGIGLCGNLKTMEAFVEFLGKTLGFRPTIHPIPKRDGGDPVCFRIVISGKAKPISVLRVLYGASTLYLDRKARKVHQLGVQ